MQHGYYLLRVQCTNEILLPSSMIIDTRSLGSTTSIHQKSVQASNVERRFENYSPHLLLRHIKVGSSGAYFVSTFETFVSFIIQSPNYRTIITSLSSCTHPWDLLYMYMYNTNFDLRRGISPIPNAFLESNHRISVSSKRRGPIWLIWLVWLVKLSMGSENISLRTQKPKLPSPREFVLHLHCMKGHIAGLLTWARSTKGGVRWCMRHEYKLSSIFAEKPLHLRQSQFKPDKHVMITKRYFSTLFGNPI